MEKNQIRRSELMKEIIKFSEFSGERTVDEVLWLVLTFRQQFDTLAGGYWRYTVTTSNLQVGRQPWPRKSQIYRTEYPESFLFKFLLSINTTIFSIFWIFQHFEITEKAEAWICVSNIRTSNLVQTFKLSNLKAMSQIPIPKHCLAPSHTTSSSTPECLIYPLSDICPLRLGHSLSRGRPPPSRWCQWEK